MTDVNSNTKPKVCSVDGCEKSHLAKGLCRSHYKKTKKCTIKGCESSLSAKGLCSSHYHRLTRYGDPLGGGPFLSEMNHGVKCSVDQCEIDKLPTQEYCRKHYRKYLKYGDPLGTKVYLSKPIEWLKKMVMSKHDDCVIWPFNKGSGGYGSINHNGKQRTAHRVALILATGIDPKDLQACHAPKICHNRLCVNPDHLRWDTIKNNGADKIKDDTNLAGIKNSQAKLVNVQVLEIRERCSKGESHTAISKDYPVGPATIKAIADRKLWSHI